MPRYRASDPGVYFCTISLLDWLPIFIESRYIDPLLDSLQFSRRNKALKLFALVIMPNHLHLIVACESGLEPVMRDFKRFTSRTIHERLRADGRTTILHWLENATEDARRARGDLGLWQPGFHPVEIHSTAVFQQKLDYLHANPVRKGLVQHPDDWWYSSARFYSDQQPFCCELDAWQY